MSLQSWKDEFYPTPAKENTDSDIKALEHSLHKWRGLTKENLEKHKVHINGQALFNYNNTVNDRGFLIDDESCALCHIYLHGDPQSRTACRDCPISHITINCSYGNDLPWREFVDGGNPLPMIQALEDALEEAWKF